MTNLIATFQDRFSDWLTALSQHLQLSLLTLLLAIFIAIPLAVYLRYHEKLADWVLQIAGIFQTIPSLALLGLFIPLMRSFRFYKIPSLDSRELIQVYKRLGLHLG